MRDLLARSDIDAVLIATGPNWHATAATLAAEAGKDMYCEKPCTKNISQSLLLRETIRRTGPRFSGGHATAQPAEFHVCGRFGAARQTRQTPDSSRAPGRFGDLNERLVCPRNRSPREEQIDWDTFLGPAAWRPFNNKWLDAFNFEKGGGLTGGGCLEWGSHCVDLCQWANDADNTSRRRIRTGRR